MFTNSPLCAKIELRHKLNRLKLGVFLYYRDTIPFFTYTLFDVFLVKSPIPQAEYMDFVIPYFCLKFVSQQAELCVFRCVASSAHFFNSGVDEVI